MEAATHLRVVDTETGEICESTDDRDYVISDLRDQLAGHLKTIEMQSKRIGALERRVQEEEGEVDSHPKGREIRDLFERWQTATGRTTTKLGKPRVKLVKSRLRDGFSITSEDAEPTLELAVDGVAAYPYRRYRERFREQVSNSDLEGFDDALKDEKHVEVLSRYGWKARQAGWTVEGGWPE